MPELETQIEASNLNMARYAKRLLPKLKRLIFLKHLHISEMWPQISKGNGVTSPNFDV